ncbi:hypothetical protein SCLCIDRAFT_791514 [Scleroderma citrinum Foug A]|uniref:Uncharacterized protein n=1 Tax=Scleroderma citrinum Foug A TaxID=1036808 RepID=A0A0C3ACT9_9AGAM|nr:hypothetical protein SCLCIDRAFT_791514 [Scleroderma citrinum Foug A]
MVSFSHALLSLTLDADWTALSSGDIGTVPLAGGIALDAHALMAKRWQCLGSHGHRYWIIPNAISSAHPLLGRSNTPPRRFYLYLDAT